MKLKNLILKEIGLPYPDILRIVPSLTRRGYSTFSLQKLENDGWQTISKNQPLKKIIKMLHKEKHKGK